MRILAVDDDDMILELLVASLSAHGFTEIKTATSARAAVDVMAEAEEPFDCFLLDIQMPEIDGIELCKAIRRSRAYANAPIIMITAMSQKSYIDRAFAAGATDYVTKPFDPIELGTRIKLASRLVDQRRTIDENQEVVEGLRAQLERERFIDLGDPLTIEDVEGVIGMQSLENYLLQLNRSGLFATSIFAIKVVGIETIYAASSPTDYRYLVTDVAEAISTAMNGIERFISYAGNGVFVCVAHGRSGPDIESIETAANLVVQEMALTNSRGAPLNIQLRAGSPVRVGLVRAGRGAVDAVYVAIEHAEHEALRPEGARWNQNWAQFGSA